MGGSVLTESAVLTEASPLTSGPEAGKGIWRTRIIEADVQGSSGFYPAEVLRRDGPNAFPAGTHVYLDHPTSGEDQDRPERSVKDLAGYLVDGAQYEESVDGSGLFARIQFIPEIKERIKSLAPVIGLSIRAAGEVERAPDGRNIVRTIAEGLSVDVVTRAGAGGRLVTMTESTKPETPPVEQATPNNSTVAGTIPSTSGTGALLNEVSAMRTSISDQMETLAIEVNRLAGQLRESQKETKQAREENSAIREALTTLNDRQAKSDQKIGEAQNISSIVSAIAESRLPLAAQLRLAQAYFPGQDIHERIQVEREYAKKLFRESGRGGLGPAENETSGLGLAEAASKPDFTLSTDDDYTDLENMLSGKGAL